MARYIVEDHNIGAARGTESAHGLEFGADFQDESITFETKDRRIVLAWKLTSPRAIALKAHIATTAATATA